MSAPTRTGTAQTRATTTMDARHDTTTADAPKAEAAADAGLDSGPPLYPGEYCVGGPPNITFDPPLVVVAAGHFRPVRAIVEPDICSPSTLSFTSSNSALVPVPPSGA